MPAAWLPASHAQDGVLVELYRTRAATNPMTLPGPAATLPLSTYRIAAAECRRPDRARQADTAWRLTVLGPETRLELVGSWLGLAWAGHLGGWAEPAQRPA